ncbi:uncharacterized protein LOC578543 isoform X2 [Strongylocentrotus purpuratus]|nr:uncharacterized protein LOC578543 isoform X2 [Strongylocentrotus purpuratus]|eukprot:XP_800004.2 PREDICTED: uncharacterized protein LOC578543 [Strongylocentrotus purpuratus]
MMARSGEESCTQSSVGLESISFNPLLPHPQSWTVVPEFNMGLRQQRTHETFGNWKYDVQCQIANISQKLKDSLEEHPDDRVRGCDVPWRPTLTDPTGRDLPLYEQQKRPIGNPAPAPPSREETENFYKANSTANPSYPLSFGLERTTISR